MNIKYFNYIKRVKDNYSKNNLELAYKYAKKLYEISIDDDRKIESLYYKAMILQEIGDLEKSFKTFEKILEIDKNQVSAMCGIANIKEIKGDFEEAEKLYRKCIKTDYKNDRVYFFLANLLDTQGKYNQAIEYYKKVIELNPKDYMACNNLGAIYENIDDFEKALDILNKSIKINGEYFGSYFNKGVVFGRLGDLKKAIKNYELSIEKDRGYVYNYLNMSALYIEGQLYSKAISILDKGIKNADEKVSDLYYNKACIFSKIHMDKCALKYLEKSIDFDKGIKEYVVQDEDFERFYTDKRFLEIVGE